MNAKLCFSVALLGFVLVPVRAEEPQRETFGKWRIGVGAAFNSRIRARLRPWDLPAPAAFAVPTRSTKDRAWERACARRYDGGGYIDTDSLDNGFDTENWKLPTTDYRGDGRFELDNAYQEVLGGSVGCQHWDGSADRNQFGISIEAARELWIHDERDEHRWGLDFAAAFSYFFARDIYQSHGCVARRDQVRDGRFRTDVVDADAMYDYDHDWDSPRWDAEIGADVYGYGNAERTFINPALGFAGIELNPIPIEDPVRAVGSGYGYFASGDYQELEMLFLLRPWYEIYDWWRVFAQIGVGVSWGRFDADFRCSNFAVREDFAQWDCYGAAGLGTALRYKRLTLTVDVLGRFLRDDFEVDGRFVRGSIARSDWGLRLMLGYEF